MLDWQELLVQQSRNDYKRIKRGFQEGLKEHNYDYIFNLDPSLKK